jgi:hypothetical protein
MFVSHKHADKQIADIISAFISTHSGGRIEVFQSSSPWTNAPKIGRNLNQELRKALWTTRALILVYTTPDSDWNYCMYECGVASHPESTDSKLIVFQCGASVPALFAEQVNVDARNFTDIQKFTNEFLTDPEFLPGYGGALTKFAANSPQVINAASDLSQKLLKPGILPPDKVAPEDEWPAYPFIQFELSEADVAQISSSGARKRSRKAAEIVESKCLIRKADKYAEQLFGMPSFPPGMKLKQLEAMWRERHPKSESKWLQALSEQIIDGAMWRFPSPVWEFMQGVNDGAWYAPMINRVRKIPSQLCFQFDIYFHKFNGDPGKYINLPAQFSNRA